MRRTGGDGHSQEMEPMKKILIIALILATSSVVAKKKKTRYVEKRSIVVNLGSSKVVELPFTPGEVIKGDLGDADIDPDTGEPMAPSDTYFEAKWNRKKKVRIRGLKIGSGNLEIFDKRGKKRMEILIYISSPEKSRYVSSIRKMLKEVEGVEVGISGDDITIDGELFRQQDKERIERIVDKMSTSIKIINLTRYSPLFMRAMAKKIEKEINDPQIHIKSLKDKFMIKGKIQYTATGKSDAASLRKDQEALQIAQQKRQRYYDIATAYLGDGNYTGAKKDGSSGVQTIVPAVEIIKKTESQEIDKLVRIQFDFVELAKTYLKKFGFSWTPGITSPDRNAAAQKEFGGIGDMSQVSYTPEKGLTSIITGTIRNLFPKLHNAKQFGHARTLESSQVITKNKTQVTFNSGKKVILVEKGDRGDTTRIVDFGLNSTYTPEIIQDNSAISLDINITYQSLPPGGLISAGSNIPSHTIRSTMIIESGQSAAIGGMISNLSWKMYDKIPRGLEDSLFGIYHSKDFVRNKSQMVMFITPTIVDNAASGTKELKRKFRVK